MKAYRIVVHDCRAPAPIELTAELRGDARAREFAQGRLAASDHIVAIEVWSGPERLCRFSDRRRAA